MEGTLGHHPAVDDDHLPGDVGGFIRGQEGDGSGDVLDRPESSQRDLLQDRLLHLLEERVREVRGHEAGGDRVTGDVAARHLARDGLREADEAGLRRGVIRLARIPGDARDR